MNPLLIIIIIIKKKPPMNGKGDGKVREEAAQKGERSERNKEEQ